MSISPAIYKCAMALCLGLLLPGTAPGQAPPVTAGLKVRLDAATITGVANGGPVPLWNDSALGLIAGDADQNAASVPGAGTPTYTAADPLFGGRPAVTFDGNDALGFVGSLGLATNEGAQAFTVFIVATSQSGGIASGFTLGDIVNGIGDGSGGSCVKCDLSTNASGLRFNDGSRLFGASFDPTPARIGFFRMGVGTNYGNATFRSDNRPPVQSSVGNAAATPNFLDEGYYVGGAINGVTGLLGEFANGRIAEILFYTRELSDTEAEAVGSHLESKYNLATGYVRRPPNMVVFLSDDHGWHDASLYGSTAITTTNLDRVAALGMTFNRAFVASPSCAPSRASLLTGLYPARHGAEPNHSYPGTLNNPKKLPAYLQELGYEVVAIGKIGHYHQTANYGFDLAQDYEPANREVITNAVAWLQSRTNPQPLCLFVGDHWPHIPWPNDTNQFPPATIQLPPTQVDTLATRADRSRYLAAVRALDLDFGQLYDAAAAKFGNDFFFLHTSDHGAQLPFSKWNLYDAGIRTPFMAVWPGEIPTNSRTDAMVSWIDVLPTLVDVAGGTPPPVSTATNGIDGFSILPVLRGEATNHRSAIFTTHSGDGTINVYPIRGVRSAAGWKYIRNLRPEFLCNSHIAEGSDYWPTWLATAAADSRAAQRVNAYQYRPAAELYDLNTDPWELTNLIDNVAYVAPASNLSAQLDQWMLETGDPQSLFGTPTYPPGPPPFPPASLTNDLFVDTFQRANSDDTDATSDGMSGSRVPPLGPGSAYSEGFQGGGNESIRILGGLMQMAVGAGMSENGLMHNFVGQDIIDAGGFSVELTVHGMHSTGDTPANRYAGFGVGLSQAEAAAGGDITGPNTFRGSTANPVGKADFFIDLDMSGNLKVWRKGQLMDTVPVGVTKGTITAKFALAGFTTSGTVTVTVFFNGQPLDINTGNTNAITRVFSWDADNSNYIGLSAGVNGYADIDNLAIRKLPLAGNLSVAYALAAGLAGSDTAPAADPDGDGRSNFVEWVIGSNPAIADASIAPVTLLSVEPGQNRFRFQVRRVTSPETRDLDYVIKVSPDLEIWTAVTATVVSPPQPVPGVPGYETVELELPPATVAGQPRLFVVVRASPKS